MYARVNLLLMYVIWALGDFLSKFYQITIMPPVLIRATKSALALIYLI